jgi:hypothetical protein
MEKLTAVAGGLALLRLVSSFLALLKLGGFYPVHVLVDGFLALLRLKRLSYGNVCEIISLSRSLDQN